MHRTASLKRRRQQQKHSSAGAGDDGAGTSAADRATRGVGGAGDSNATKKSQSMPVRASSKTQLAEDDKGASMVMTPDETAVPDAQQTLENARIKREASQVLRASNLSMTGKHAHVHTHLQIHARTGFGKQS